jgi:C-terminal processing protease CtpA/Prc
MVGTETRITGVRASSPAYEAGIRQGDILVAVWGRLVKYLSIHEIVDLMLEKTSLETKCTIEHGVSVGVKNFGAEFKMQFDGMTVSRVQDGSSAKEAGLKEQDIITAINGNSTRYMPLKKALELIKNSANDTVMLTFRRDLVIWGKEGG